MVSHGSLLQSLPPRSNWPIVGREADIELLMQRLVAGSGGVIVMGAPGLGKSTVMAAVLTKIDAIGQRAMRLPAPLERDSSASYIEQWLGVPIPSSVSVDMVATQILGQLLLSTSSTSGDPEVSAEVALAPILALDDIHLLDVFSAAVFRSLVEAGQIRLVATCREDPGLPSALDALWRSGHLDRSDLVPLSYDSVRLILRAVLPDPASNDMAYRLWLTTAGNPLHVRELLYSIVETGDVVYAEHAWIWVAPLRANRRLVDLLATDLKTLGGPARDVMDLLALAEMVPLRILTSKANDDDLKFLVERGLILVTDGNGAATVSIAHPLYAETLRSLLYPRRKRELFDFMPEPGPEHGPQELLRWVDWALECDVMPGVSTLIAAGTAAEELTQPGRAVTLATLALEHPHLPAEQEIEALLLRARSNRDAGWSESAEADLDSLLILLEESQDSKVTVTAAPERAEDIVVHAARIRADIQELHYRDLDGALEGLAAAAKTLDPSGNAATELAIDQLARIGHGGRHAEVLAGWAAQVAAADLPANITLSPSYIYALGQTGKAQSALAVAETQLALIGPDHARYPFARTDLVAARFWAAVWAGQPAMALTVPDLDGAGGQRHHSGLYQIGEGYIYLIFGDWVQAVEQLRGGLSRLGLMAPTGLEAMAWAGLAHAYAMCGERALACAAVEHYLSVAPVMNRSIEVDSRYRILLARYAVGDPQLADFLDAYLLWATREGHALGVLYVRHLLIVCAEPGERAELLPALELAAEDIEGLIPQAMLRHAAALIAGDAGMIAAGGAGLVAVGIWLPAPVQLATLTQRQREIAALAGAGMSNKAIALKLQLSVRTVDTHMGNIFVRLGIANRTELATALTASS
ncbi:hypothetical protein CVS30_09495 [Arthrobacter psychrolactophilus]|uniref:HTH luxR-type domain-containing protein n=2 Tax=Arthrobacter psychrolactophilus TaxID=92442 RepID=A0A2V5JFV7_9MICC|nr:hypothetical protein CVS30_09495 [Arthrobacter psychrolactophilus]